MFIIDGTTDLAHATARLGRLMYNIERGVKVYEWAPGSTSEPLPEPRSALLSIDVPGVTGAPSATAEYRPSVGFVYYSPESTGLNIPALVDSLKAILAGLPDDHLTGHLPVEVAPHATLLHKGRTYQGTEETICHRDPHTTGWRPDTLYPTRRFYRLERTHITAPSHVSLRAAFTWYIAPIALAARIRWVASFEAFNALVAGVYLDTLLGGAETPSPLLGPLTPEFFGATPLPKALAACASQAHELILIHVGTQLELASGSHLREVLGRWQNPDHAVRGRAPQNAQIANLSQPGITRSCGFCALPLWGDVYAITDEIIAPQFMAVCRWCCGCLPPNRLARAARVASWTSLREAYTNSCYKHLLPLLEAQVTRLRPAIHYSPVFLLELEGGEKAFLEPEEESPETSPVCLRVAELRNLRLSSLKWRFVASFDKRDVRR